MRRDARRLAEITIDRFGDVRAVQRCADETAVLEGEAAEIESGQIQSVEPRSDEARGFRLNALTAVADSEGCQGLGPAFAVLEQRQQFVLGRLYQFAKGR